MINDDIFQDEDDVFKVVLGKADKLDTMASKKSRPQSPSCKADPSTATRESDR